MITELDCHRIIVLHHIECISTETIMHRTALWKTYNIILLFIQIKSGEKKRSHLDKNIIIRFLTFVLFCI